MIRLSRFHYSHAPKVEYAGLNMATSGRGVMKMDNPQAVSLPEDRNLHGRTDEPCRDRKSVV